MGILKLRYPQLNLNHLPWRLIMIKTLADASQMICPFRMTNFTSEQYIVYCSTNKCMAWEFESIPVSKPSRFGTSETVKSNNTGYCRLVLK